MHVLVVTCAHRGDDARIVHRQARVLLAHGHRVTLVSPAVADASADPEGLERVTVRRAVGRRRMAAWRDVRRAVATHIDRCDLVLIHDPELVLLSPLWRRRPVVWDVHEDFASSVADRRWIPRPAQGPMEAVVRFVQRWAARRLRIIIAEDSYAGTFAAAPVVPNSTWMPAEPSYAMQSPPRVVYVGRISTARGVDEMIELGSLLRGEVGVVLIGSPDADVAPAVRRAHEAGLVDARGPLPNPEALGLVQGAVAGLSLLHDIPNYRHSRPTKIAEYLAHGVPVVSTPLPLAAEMLAASGGGVVVPHGDVPTVAAAAAGAIRGLLADPDRRSAMASSGRAYVAEHHSWDVDGGRFVALLESWAV